MQLSARDLTLKLVYYGPALSGKTTNLARLQERLALSGDEPLTRLDAADERTLFFDLLPLDLPVMDFSLRLRVFTVPGQQIHAATRRMVVGGADGIAFVADSRRSATEANASSLAELGDNLLANDLRIGTTPLVIQFNKRDLPDIRSDEELRAMAGKGREPVYGAIASRGVGVAEAFMALLRTTWRRLDQQHDLEARTGMSSRAVLLGAARRLGLRDDTAETSGFDAERGYYVSASEETT